MQAGYLFFFLILICVSVCVRVCVCMLVHAGARVFVRGQLHGSQFSGNFSFIKACHELRNSMLVE